MLKRLKNYLLGRSSNRGTSCRSARNRTRLGVENLEDRQLMSCMPVPVPTGIPQSPVFILPSDPSTLHIDTTNEPDMVTIDSDPSDPFDPAILIHVKLGRAPTADFCTSSRGIDAIRISTLDGVDTINLSAFASKADVQSGDGFDFLNIQANAGAFKGQASGIRGDTVSLFDRSGAAGREYRIQNFLVWGDRDTQSSWEFPEVASLSLYTSDAGGKVFVFGSPGAPRLTSLQVFAGAGPTTIIVGNDNRLTQLVDMNLTVWGQGGDDNVVLDDSKAQIGRTFSTRQFGGTGILTRDNNFTLNHSGLQSVHLDTGPSADTVKLQGPLTTPLTVTGGDSLGDVLQWYNTGAATWHITGTNTGNVNGLTFVNFDHLVGSTGPDRFVFESVAAHVVSIDGGTGLGDTLDYSLFMSPVTVDLSAGIVPGCSFSQIENVIGGNGDDTITGNGDANILVGGAGNDHIYGLDGRDILIGGLGGDTLDGGDGEDILIGGTTAYDLNDNALVILMNEWNRTNANSSYATRLANIEAGLTVTKDKFRLTRGTTLGSLSATVLADESKDTLTGGVGTALDWFFADAPRTMFTPGGGTIHLPGDAVTDRQSTEIVR